MNKLWAPVPIHQLKSRAEDRSRKNFRNVESVLTQDYRLPYPTTLECFLKLTAPGDGLSEAELQEMSVRWICSVIPGGLAALGFFGYGCVHGTCRRMSMAMSLGLPEIDELGEKFEGIYPILIGPPKSCAGMAAAMGGRAAVSSVSDQVGILSIVPDEIKTVSESAAVREWIVPRPNIPNKAGPRVFVVPPKPNPT